MSQPGQYQTDVSDMYAVHHGITGALGRAPGLVGGADSTARVDLVSNYYENVLEFLHVHHAGEDELIYPLLEQRCTDQDDMLERIDAQHGLLHEPMNAARGALVQWRVEPTVTSAAAVTSALSRVVEVLAPHLTEEETNVLPLASAWISPEEWGEMPGHALSTFAADKPWVALGLVMDNLNDAQRAAMASSMPPPVAAMWHDQWEPQYRALMASLDG